MNKTYEAKKNFWIGEINKEIKKGVQIEYDDDRGVLMLDGKRHEVKNLKAAIKAEWLVPMDGVFPTLDGPVGETESQAVDRRRRGRLEETKAAQAKSGPKLIKDQREVKQIKKLVGGIAQEGTHEFFDAMGLERPTSPRPKYTGGVIDEDAKVVTVAIPAFKDTKGKAAKKSVGIFQEGSAEYMDALGIEPPKAKRGKFAGAVVEDDTKVVMVQTPGFEDKEVKMMKKALNQTPKELKGSGVKEFKVFNDSIDDGVIEVGKYTSVDQTVKNWSSMNGAKKEGIIKTASKEMLKELKVVESSKKIKEKIQKRLEEVPNQ